MCSNKRIRNDLAHHRVRVTERSKHLFFPVFLLCSRHRQTLPKKVQDMKTRESDENSIQAPDMESNAKQEDQPEPSTRDLLTKPVLLTISAHGWFSFLEIASWVLLPLVYTTPIEFGGLGFDPATMGICMAVYGVMKGVLQLTVFHRILDFLGLRTALIAFISGLIPLFLLFPVGGIHVRNEGTVMVLWMLVLIQLISTIGVNMAYGTSRPVTHRASF